jgi:ribosomal protein S18 acetylase RimI-like enzyme
MWGAYSALSGDRMTKVDLTEHHVRAASLEDEKEVIDLWRRCGLVVSHNDPSKDFRFALLSPCSSVLVLSSEDTIIGSVMVGYDGHRGWVYYVAVDGAKRQKGLGKVIMSAAEDWLRARQVPKLQLLVRDTNASVLSFYDRLGFELGPVRLMQKWLEDRPT